MTDEATMRARLQEYIDAFDRSDLEALVELFADDAQVEDPVGSPVKDGKEAIRAFYRESLKTGAKLELVAPIRASHANAAAMAFTVNLNMPTGPSRIHVIDVMYFNESGQISSMQAYWGHGDMERTADQ